MALRRCLQPWIQQHLHLLEHRVPQAACSYSAGSGKQPEEPQQQPQQPSTSEAASTSSSSSSSSSSTAAGNSSKSSSSPTGTLTAATPRPKAKGEEEWTEVIDEKSGQTYYWNEKTGETTELGEPKPKTRFRDQEWEQAAKQGPFQEGWREPPGRDHTYFYSVVGVAIGIAAGWFTQYLH